MNTNDEQERIVKKKVMTFQKLKEIVHISLKNGIWKRGSVLSSENADFFILEERLEGKIPIFYVEVKDIQLYREEERNG